ncbi:hypothetical protein ES702_06058 [subsurface metagenome]
MKRLLVLLSVLSLFGQGMYANSEEEIEALRRIAEAEAAEEAAEEAPEEVTFKAKGLSLQALNPEISVTGDMVAYYRDQDGVTERAKVDFRCLGLHFESYLDPYSRFKAAIPINENGAELGEAYFTRFGMAKGLNLTLGKFRQQFGVVNRWHKHGLDQVDFPLPLRMIFGDGGLNQSGLSLDWAMPPLGSTLQELTLQITEAKNERVFGENTKATPSVLAHYKNYRDLSKDTYLEFGLTGLLGWNDEWSLTEDVIEHESLPASVLGTDLTLLWEPTERMRYRNFVWRSEAYFLNKDILAPDGAGGDTLNAWGGYTYLQSKVSRTCEIGIRADYYQPDSKDYAETAGLSPLAVMEDDAYRWQIGPYVTWYQSPWVKFRFEYNHQDGHHMDEPEDRLIFQCIFAAGPHKHERY